MLTAKAYNGRVLCAWLADCSIDLLRQHPDELEYQLMSACLPCAQFFLCNWIDAKHVPVQYACFLRVSGNNFQIEIEKAGYILSPA